MEHRAKSELVKFNIGCIVMVVSLILVAVGLCAGQYQSQLQHHEAEMRCAEIAVYGVLGVIGSMLFFRFGIF